MRKQRSTRGPFFSPPPCGEGSGVGYNASALLREGDQSELCSSRPHKERGSSPPLPRHPALADLPPWQIKSAPWAAANQRDGQITSDFQKSCQARNQKYFCFRPTQIRCISPDVPFPLEGRIAIVTDVGDGMRWTRERQARKAIAGRDEPRERNVACRMIGAFAYGEAVSFWHPLLVSSSRRQSRPNRAGQTLIRGRR
jgi:hypothetical protein